MKVYYVYDSSPSYPECINSRPILSPSFSTEEKAMEWAKKHNIKIDGDPYKICSSELE